MQKNSIMIKKIFKIRFIRYAIWWWLAALLDIFLLWFFTNKLWFFYLYSAILSFIVAFSFWYIYQKYITFWNYSKKHLRQSLLFLLFQLLWQALYLLLLWFLVTIFWFYYLYVAFFWKWVVFLWNYFMNHFFNFK